MSLVLTRSQVRSVDRRAITEYGMSGLVLMENAGRSAADVLLQQAPKGRIVIVCGKGNNGGDGLVIARHLDNHEIRVRVLLLCQGYELRGEAAVNFHILRTSGVDFIELPDLTSRQQELVQAELADAEWIVDALLGTGTTGAPREPLATAIRLMNAAPAKKLAIDIPSGLDCDTGTAAATTIRADHTCTLVALKPGLLTPAAAEYCGQIHVIDIGVPRKLLAEIVREGHAS